MVATRESSYWFLCSMFWVSSLQRNECIPVVWQVSRCRIITWLVWVIYASRARFRNASVKAHSANETMTNRKLLMQISSSACIRCTWWQQSWTCVEDSDDWRIRVSQTHSIAKPEASLWQVVARHFTFPASVILTTVNSREDIFTVQVPSIVCTLYSPYQRTFCFGILRGRCY